MFQLKMNPKSQVLKTAHIYFSLRFMSGMGLQGVSLSLSLVFPSSTQEEDRSTAVLAIKCFHFQVSHITFSFTSLAKASHRPMTNCSGVKCNAAICLLGTRSNRVFVNSFHDYHIRQKKNRLQTKDHYMQGEPTGTINTNNWKVFVDIKRIFTFTTNQYISIRIQKISLWMNRRIQAVMRSGLNINFRQNFISPLIYSLYAYLASQTFSNRLQQEAWSSLVDSNLFIVFNPEETFAFLGHPNKIVCGIMAYEDRDMDMSYFNWDWRHGVLPVS